MSVKDTEKDQEKGRIVFRPQGKEMWKEGGMMEESWAETFFLEKLSRPMGSPGVMSPLGAVLHLIGMAVCMPSYHAQSLSGASLKEAWVLPDTVRDLERQQPQPTVNGPPQGRHPRVNFHCCHARLQDRALRREEK